MAGKWKDRKDPPSVKGTSRARDPKPTTKDRICQTYKGERTVKGKTCPACRGTGGVNIGTV